MKLRNIPNILRRMYTQKFQQIAVEPSDMCNLDCPSCKRVKPGTGFMSPETFDIIMKRLKGEVKSVFLYGKGEATLSPYLPTLTETAYNHECDVRLSINSCVPLRKSYVERLLKTVKLFRVCVDGYNQKTLQLYRRGGSWNVLLQNLDTIRQVGPCYATKEMGVLAFRYNEGHENEYRVLAQKFGIDRLSWTLPIINWRRRLSEEEAATWLAQNAKYQRYERVNGEWIHKTARYCLPDPFITVDGTLYGCCRDRFMTQPLGNMLEDDLTVLRHRLFRFWLNALRKNYPFCRFWCWQTKMPVEILEPC